MNAERRPRVTPQPAGESRHRARQAAVQMLYQWEVGRLSMSEVVASFWHLGAEEVDVVPEPARAFAIGLAEGTAERIAEVDPLIAEAAAHWRLERMQIVDRLILRLAVYEFLCQPETPAAVIIDEALELGRSFSADASVPFINGVLDAIRRKLERT
jgi:transcription antitermination protein NusB